MHNSSNRLLVFPGNVEAHWTNGANCNLPTPSAAPSPLACHKNDPGQAEELDVHLGEDERGDRAPISDQLQSRSNLF